MISKHFYVKKQQHIISFCVPITFNNPTKAVFRIRNIFFSIKQA